MSWDGDTVLIVPGGTSAGTPDEALGRAPDGQAARESFLRPLVPLEGGWVVVDLGIDKEDPVSVAGGFLTTTVPLWVELVYGYDVVLAAQQLLTEVEDAEDSRQLRLAREVPTTWHSAPTMTARVLCRIAQGLWMRRYWPSPADGSVRQLDRVALDMELIALSQKGNIPLCLAADGGVGALLLTPMAQEFNMVSSGAMPPRLAPYPVLVGTATTGQRTKPATTVGSAPSIPATATIARAERSTSI
mgnify:CR=1 FL=1